MDLGTSFLGHFMGKKSLEPLSLSLVGTAPPNTQRDQRLQLSHDLLRILLLKKALGMNLSGPAPSVQVSPDHSHSASMEELPATVGSGWDRLAGDPGLKGGIFQLLER